MAEKKYIELEEVRDVLADEFGLTNDQEERIIGRINHRAKSITAADVRPVVLCRDCRWWTKQEKSLQGRCELAGFYPTGEWFCANGERSNCVADMREPNLDTTKGENHD